MNPLTIPSRTPALISVMGVLVTIWPALTFAAVLQPGISGTILDDGGAATGAAVTLYAWPNELALMSLPEGASVPLLRVGHTLAGSDGSWALPVHRLPPQYVDAGVTNFELIVSYGTSELDWSEPLAISASGDAWQRPEDARTLRNSRETLSIDLGRNQVSVGAFGAPHGTWVRVRTTDTVTTPLAASNLLADGTIVPEAGGCYTIAGTIYYGINELFTDVFGWSGSTVEVRETTATYHTLGIGYQTSGGTWSQNGTAGITLTTATGTDQTGFIDRAIYNKVNYRDYTRTAPCSGTSRRPYSSYQLLGYTPAVSHVYFSACGTASYGVYWKDNVANMTFNAGVNLGPINVSVQAGWNQNTEIAQHFTAPSWFCGNSPGGVDQSTQIEAHQY